MKSLSMLPIENIFPHPDNPRKNLGDLSELAGSIKKNGIMQNLTVVPKGDGVNYTVIIGHRRLSAAKQAGLMSVPCVITEMSANDQVATMLLENVQRAELTPYEQMKGFQMLLDLGETVDTISQKTGFSASTVRRRIKLTELDEKKLEEAMTRQVSLTDLAKLEEIKDKKNRNKCLAAAGTESFEREVRNAIVEQKGKENKKLMLAELDKVAKKQDNPRGYTYVGYYSFYSYKPGQFESLGKGEYIYSLSGTGGVYIYKKAEKAKKERKSEKEILRENDIRSREKQLSEESDKAYELRKEFYTNYIPPAGNELAKYKMCAEMIILGCAYSSWTYAYKFLPFMGKENYSDAEARDRVLQEVIDEGQLQALIKYICVSYDDTPRSTFFRTRFDDYPVFEKNTRLTLLYDFLCKLGYQMTDTELQLMNGTHTAFLKAEE